jgi:ATP-dependent helicase HrpA
MRLDTDVGAGQAAGAETRRADGRERRSRRAARNEFLGPRGARFAIFPGSPLAAAPPPWIVAAELVETSRLWARDVAGIDPAWLESAAGDLVRRVYAAPRWSASRGQAVVTEKVLLYGLAIVPGRTVALARSDPALARELFVRHALVDGDWRTRHEFFHANLELLGDADQVVRRTRNRSLAVDPEDLFAFYDERIPASVTGARSFDSWWKKARERTPDLLTLTADSLGLAAGPAVREGFPDVWVTGAFRLPVTYEFAPGSPADGATVHIPIHIAGQLQPDGFDWQVPGLRADLVAGLIKSLPKAVRVGLVPAPDTARAAVARLGEMEDWREASGRIPPLTEALARVFRETRDVIVPAEVWSYERVPDHLRLRFAVENARGEAMAVGFDLAAVVHEADPLVREAIAALVRARGPATGGGPGTSSSPDAEVAWPGERDLVTTWDFGDLPREIAVDLGGGIQARGYPAVVDTGNGVAVRVVTDRARAGRDHPRGVRALLLGELRLPVARVTSRLGNQVKLALASWRGGGVPELIGDVQAAAVDGLMGEHGGAPMTQGGYAILRERLADLLEDRVYRIVLALAGTLREAAEVTVRLGQVTELAVLNSATDIRRHLDGLFAPGFVTRGGEARLADLRRYVATDAYRLEQLGQAQAREHQGIWLVEQMWEAYRAAVDGLPPGGVIPPALAEVPWMIEELRVSVFAQRLGTAYPVSEQRIRRAIAAAKQ